MVRMIAGSLHDPSSKWRYHHRHPKGTVPGSKKTESVRTTLVGAIHIVPTTYLEFPEDNVKSEACSRRRFVQSNNINWHRQGSRAPFFGSAM
jgi:hypothetical protein